MALTREFKKTVVERAQREPAFRRGLLEDAINEFLAGEVGVAKILIRDYINATIEFPTLARKIHKNNKGLQKMFGPNGNPTINNFCAILKVLQKKEGITLQASSSEKRHH
ncbi:MAG: transcriptional regulator [Gammaproteobacteria bacterium]|jgi:DNA-binding phage protein